MEIKDSGTRREFDTGAVRDIQEGKGRCDLLPLGVLAEIFNNKIFQHIETFKNTGDEIALYRIFKCQDIQTIQSDLCTIFLDVSKHFEAGAKKYGEYNWQKGIPTNCYIDSATRHYLKYLRGDKDEPHDRAFIWNIMCCIWTCINKPELNVYLEYEETEDVVGNKERIYKTEPTTIATEQVKSIKDNVVEYFNKLQQKDELVVKAGNCLHYVPMYSSNSKNCRFCHYYKIDKCIREEN